MSIRYEFDDKPEHGGVKDIANGIRWLRMPLPMVLEHINLWLLDDDGGCAIVDTGVDVESTRELWQRTLEEALRGTDVTRILVTHLHPDHVGCAGWLTRKCGVELYMTREEYLLCRVLIADTGRAAPETGVNFYRAAGFPDDALQRYKDRFGMFGRYVTPLPESYRRLQDRDLVPIGGSDWEVIVGRGHSPEHACLYSAERNTVISGDQILPTISSNVSVHPTEPNANPLKDWLTSLNAMKTRLPEDVLVLPAHGKPFRGAHLRLDELIQEHDTALEKCIERCTEPQRAIDVFPALFKGRISDGNLIMATGESIAHLNYLVDAGQLSAETDSGGVSWYRRR